MIRPTATCDVCKAPIALRSGFALLVIEEDKGATYRVKRGITAQEYNHQHFCGAQCLVRKLSGCVDRLAATNDERNASSMRRGRIEEWRRQNGIVG